jgi:hypothetical protein
MILGLFTVFYQTFHNVLQKSSSTLNLSTDKINPIFEKNLSLLSTVWPAPHIKNILASIENSYCSHSIKVTVLLTLSHYSTVFTDVRGLRNSVSSLLFLKLL